MVKMDCQVGGGRSRSLNFSRNFYVKRLFILDGVISFPIAFLGFYLIPDTPDDSRASYLTLDVSPLRGLPWLNAVHTDLALESGAR